MVNVRSNCWAASRRNRSRRFPPPRTELLVRAIEQGQSQQVDHFEVEREVEPAAAHFGRDRLEHSAQIAFGLLEMPLLAIQQPAQPTQGPRGRRRVLVRGRPLDGFDRLVNATFAVEHTGLIQRTVVASELLDLGEGLGRLPQLGLSFQEQADAVVIPSLPSRDGTGTGSRDLLDAGDGKHHPVFGQHGNRQVISVGLAGFVTAQRPIARPDVAGDVVGVRLVELAVLQAPRKRGSVR